MLWSLVTAAFAMGLVGGPHCLAMCGGACSVLAQDGKSQTQLQLARLIGYSIAGAAIGGFAGSLVWATQHALWLKFVWTMIHVFILAWGLVLLIFARQPQWIGWPVNHWMRLRGAENAGSIIVRAPSAKRSFGVGILWPLMPCGLLYSAYLLAALSGGIWQGALVMLSFGSATVLWLIWLPIILRNRQALRQDWGIRLAGLMLALASAWMLVHIPAASLSAFCITP